MFASFVALSLVACITDGATVKASPQGAPELDLTRLRGVEARCDGTSLIVSFVDWPAPWRLTRASDGRWREDVEPTVATAGPVVDRYRAAQGWILREEALTTWMAMNPAVTHEPRLPRLREQLEALRREAMPRLSPYARLGTMPGTQSLADAWWSADGFCVAQGTSGKVRCFAPGGGWSKAVKRAQRPALSNDAAYTLRDATVSLGPIEWHVTAMAGAPWLDSIDARECASTMPTREERDAEECADPNSTRCAAWARYAPIDWPTSCGATVERLLWAPDGRAVVAIVRTAHPDAPKGTLGLWLATVAP